MLYQAGTDALFHPERADPLFGSDLPWNDDAVCAELSRLAYIHFEGADLPRLEAGLARHRFGAPKPFIGPHSDSQGYGTVGADGKAYIVYRGTQPDRIKDIASDVRFLPVKWGGGGHVHRGFAEAEEVLWAAVKSWLAEIGARPAVVTGHSLGAAMATLTAARLPASRLVTFGSPRVGDVDFARLFGGRDVRRYVDCRDAVTTVPVLLGYRHLDGERYIDAAGTVLDAPPNLLHRIEDAARADAAYLAHCFGRPGNLPAREGADHAPINYVSAILGIREGP
jgi:hypothetical protein